MDGRVGRRLAGELPAQDLDASLRSIARMYAAAWTDLEDDPAALEVAQC